MLRGFVEVFLSVPAPLAIAAVFLLTAGETALFLGFFIPGELTVILAGALASDARVPLAGVLLAGVLGPIAGDSIGYFLGRRYGRRYFAGKRKRRWAKARAWLRQRGASAVFLGRFTAFLRSVMPAAAGVAHMPCCSGERARRCSDISSDRIIKRSLGGPAISASRFSRSLFSGWVCIFSAGEQRSGGAVDATAPPRSRLGGYRERVRRLYAVRIEVPLPKVCAQKPLRSISSSTDSGRPNSAVSPDRTYFQFSSRGSSETGLPGGMNPYRGSKGPASDK